MYPYYFAYEAPAIPDVHTLSLHDALPICFAWQQIRSTLETGPVLMQVPRAGFTPALACLQCRRSARCTACHGDRKSTRLNSSHVANSYAVFCLIKKKKEVIQACQSMIYEQ